MKKVLAIVLAAIMLLGLVACSSDDAGKTTAAKDDKGGALQVGIVLPTKDEPRWLQDEESFKKILKDAGFTSEVLFSQGSSETELKNVETLIEKGVKVIVICAHDATAAGAAVKKAHDAGIKVICYDRLITDTDAVDYYVTFNSFDVGVKQGQYLIDAYKGKKDVPLYLYSGAVTDNNAFIFFSGAWSVLTKAVQEGQFKVVNCDAIANFVGKELDVDKDRDNLSKILGTITTDWDFNKAKSLAEGNLVANSADAKGDVAILAPNDGTARAIADAMAADNDVKSWVITGQDAENASVEYIKEGKQSMTVWKNTADLAKTTCDMVKAILDGKTPDAPKTYNNKTKDVPSNETPVTVITKDNTNLLGK